MFKEICIIKIRKRVGAKKSCYKSPEWYEILKYTTNSLQEQNTNSLQKQNTNSLQKQNTNQLNNENNVRSCYVWNDL